MYNNSMSLESNPEDLSPQEAFLKYQKEMEGKPIHPRMVDAAKREIEQGRKGDFAVYGDEPGKGELSRSYPKGELFRTNITENELEAEISGLSAARVAIASFLENPAVAGFTNAKEFTLGDLNSALAELSPEVARAVSTLTKYHFDNKEPLYEIPETIAQAIEKNTATLEYLRRLSSGGE
jgi:hypothetical protein